MIEELFHYCSNQKCFGILESQNIRLSDVQKSNDYKELSLFFPKIFKEIERLYKEDPFPFKYYELEDEAAFLDLLHLTFRDFDEQFVTGEFSNFMLCFSESPDSLSQWRGYAADGKGCCLGFNYKQLLEYCSSNPNVLRLEKVEYLTDDEIHEVIVSMAKECINLLRTLREWIVENMTGADNDPNTDWLLAFNFTGMLENIFTESLKYKSKAFCEEKEWRVFFSHSIRNPNLVYSENVDVLGPNGFKETVLYLNKRIEFMVTDDDLVPFCPIKFNEFKENPVSSIWLGPKNFIRKNDLDLYLKSKEYKTTKIYESKITYC